MNLTNEAIIPNLWQENESLSIINQTQVIM